MTKNVNLTINRWHQAVKRINNKRAELLEKIRSLGKIESIILTPGMKLEVEGSRADQITNLATQFVSLGETLVTIRSIIANKNVELGISTEMARQSVAAQDLALTEYIVSVTRSASIHHAMNREVAQSILATLTRNTENSADKTLFTHAVNVNFLSTKFLDEAELHRDLYQSKINKSADVIADLNRERVEIEISDQAALIIGEK